MTERVTGPRKTCPACKGEDVTDPRFCGPGDRAWTGFLVRCAKEGKHLHQRCRTCSFKWTGTPAEVR